MGYRVDPGVKNVMQETVPIFAHSCFLFGVFVCKTEHVLVGPCVDQGEVMEVAQRSSKAHMACFHMLFLSVRGEVSSQYAQCI